MVNLLVVQVDLGILLLPNLQKKNEQKKVSPINFLRSAQLTGSPGSPGFPILPGNPCKKLIEITSYTDHMTSHVTNYLHHFHQFLVVRPHLEVPYCLGCPV